VQNPQFENYNLAGYMPGPDLMGAAKADYQARLDAANAANAGKSNLTKGLFGLAGSAIGGPIGGVLGGQLGSMFG
jgi:hypothetical protein